MSHFTEIKTQIKDIAALELACTELGISLVHNAMARGYAKQQIHAEHVIRLKGPYDIAVNQQLNGTFGLKTDWWAGHVEKEVGKDFGRLLQLYGVHKATLEARKKGLSVQRHQQSNGSIKLVLLGV